MSDTEVGSLLACCAKSIQGKLDLSSHFIPLPFVTPPPRNTLHQVALSAKLTASGQPPPPSQEKFLSFFSLFIFHFFLPFFLSPAMRFKGLHSRRCPEHRSFFFFLCSSVSLSVCFFECVCLSLFSLSLCLSYLSLSPCFSDEARADGSASSLTWPESRLLCRRRSERPLRPPPPDLGVKRSRLPDRGLCS